MHDVDDWLCSSTKDNIWWRSNSVEVGSRTEHARKHVVRHKLKQAGRQFAVIVVVDGRLFVLVGLWAESGDGTGLRLGLRKSPRWTLRPNNLGRTRRLLRDRWSHPERCRHPIANHVWNRRSVAYLTSMTIVSNNSNICTIIVIIVIRRLIIIIVFEQFFYHLRDHINLGWTLNK